MYNLLYYFYFTVLSTKQIHIIRGIVSAFYLYKDVKIKTFTFEIVL